MSDDELVLGLPRDLALPDGAWRGYRAGVPASFLDALARHGSYRRRGDAEVDPTWKQVIPYLVVRDGDAVLLMRRTRAGSEARLHERWTIGVGGHVNPGDGGLAGGMAREWGEELVADWLPEPVPLGLLNDDTDSAGAVHLGVVHTVDAAGRPVGVRETHKLVGAFVTPAEARRVHDRMETWSALLLEHLFGRVG